MIKFSTFLKEEYQRIGGTQYGSNPGGIHIHQPTGKKYYIKFPKDEEQARVEVATAKLYNHLGVKTTNPEIVEINGKLGVKSEWLENHEPLGYEFKSHLKPEHSEDLAKLYHASVITANRDSVGLEFDNILKSPEGHLVSVDQGGSMHFRAMGGRKEFSGDSIPEKDSMRDSNYSSGELFNHALNKDSEQRSLQTIKTELTDDRIDSVINETGLDKAHAETLKRRRDLLLNQNNS